MEKTARDLGFKRISYGLFTFANFADMRFWINRTNQFVTHLFLSQTWVFCLKLEFFVLRFIVDHSKLIRLSFCHVLSWFANITKSKPNNLPLWQSVTKHTYNIMAIYNKMPKYITNPNLRFLTKKLPIRGRRSWTECTCLSWNTQ